MVDLKAEEKKVLEFWEKNRIFDKLRRKIKGGRKWSFIDGPITANNPMGVHHAWGRTYKDIMQRFKAMQGFNQRFQNGFDCQGLWVEREEEKELGLKNKEDIERYGILKFVQACRKRVEKFSKIQQEQSIRLGQWMDWENNYYTMSDENNEHNWHLLKAYFSKGMLYKGNDSVPWCWRCGTASSKHDIATEGYKEVTHTALFMQFPIKESPDEYFLIFTTTPWTVPANVSIAVNPSIKYVKVENEGVKYWIAKSRVQELDGKYKILAEKKGKELEGIEYLMPYFDFEAQHGIKHKVVLWDLASEEEGTGIVHIAPGCGAEDFDLGKKIGLKAISPLSESGFYCNGFGQFSLKKYSEVNKMVLDDLEQRRFSYKTKPYRHRYPHCWRCGNELVFRLVNEWYIKCSEKMRKSLISENKKVKWHPEYGKLRQEEWFRNMGDWLISRKRYWGLPLPIWECSCGEIEVIGSRKELRERSVDKNKIDKLPELHRPWIDEIKIKCSKCGKEALRVKDVGDAWLDAGIVPFSTLHYLSDKKYWKEWFPAELVCESIPGQFRGWFNALFWASITLTGKAPFKSLFGYETLKDEKGEEMHKSKGNAIWLDEIIEKVGADSIRLLYSLQDPAQDLRFGYNAVREPGNSIIILYNLSRLISREKGLGRKKIEDEWIVSKLNSLIEHATNEMEELHINQAARALQNFWLNDLSRGYVQFVRERLSENDPEAIETLAEVYSKLVVMCSPIIPFTSEMIWQDMLKKGIVKTESVHLSDWPKAERKKINISLEEEMKTALKIIELGLHERDKEKIGLRWPLSKLIVYSKFTSSMEKIKDVISRQVNVKEVILKSAKETELEIELDAKMTKELEAEGYARELARKIQAERKNAGLKKGELIELDIYAEKTALEYFKVHEGFLKERVNASRIKFSDGKMPENAVVSTIKEEKIGIKFRNC